MLFQYTLRNLWARRKYVFPIFLSIAAAVTGAVLVRANMDSLFASVLQQGEPDNAVVIARDARSEDLSSIPASIVPTIAVSPAIARAGNESIVSAELITAKMVRTLDDAPTFLIVRGVDPTAMLVHPRVHLVRGQLFHRGDQAVIVGARLLGKYKGIADDGSIDIGRHRWRVVGVFDAAGTAYESELWADRSALMTELDREDISMVVAKLAPGADALGELKRVAEQVRERPLAAMSAVAFLHQSLGQFHAFRDTTSIVTMLLFVGSLAACASAMYTAVLGRRRELATLYAIGFRRRTLALLLLLESVLLALSGGLLGAVASLLFRGTSVTYADTRSYDLMITPAVLGAGVTMAIAIGVFGGVFALVQSWRMNMLDSLRG